MILFDPPHKNFTHRNAVEQGLKIGRHRSARYAFIYGQFSTAYIKSFICDAFIEFSRILKDDGVVLFKWNSCSIKLKKVLPLCRNFVPMFGQDFGRGNNKDSETTWLCMRKDLNGKQEVLK